MVQLKNDCFLAGKGGLLKLAEVRALLEKNFAGELAKKPLTQKKIIAVDKTLGCVAAADVVAVNPVPHFANSAVDGYGFCLRDAVDLEKKTKQPVRLSVVATIAAAGRKDIFTLPLSKADQAVRIFTGGAMPKNADVVIMMEDVEEALAPMVIGGGGASPNIILPDNIGKKFQSGDNVRQIGDDVAAGQILLKKGDIITPLHVGLLAGQNINRVAVWTPLTVGVFSSGDEIKSSKQVSPILKIGEMMDSNRPMIISLLRQWGYRVVDGGVLPDRPAAMMKKMATMAKKTDLVITSGGMAVGGHDVAAGLIKKTAMQFCGVAMKPGRPIGFGTVEKKQWLAMPGNPVAVMMGLFFIIKPFLGLLQGRGRMVEPIPTMVMADFAMTKKHGRLEWVRVKCHAQNHGQGGYSVATKIAKSGSAVLSSLSEASGIVALGEDVVAVKKGDHVPYYDLGQLLNR